MNSNIESPNPGLIEREYPYRYVWSSTFIVILSGGVGTLTTTSLAISETGILWWIASAFTLMIFLGGLYIAAINLFGKRRLILTRENIYLPSVWKSENYSVIPFLDIIEIGLLNVQGNAILRLKTNIKIYEITHTWLPSMDAFNDVIKIIQERTNPPS